MTEKDAHKLAAVIHEITEKIKSGDKKARQKGLEIMKEAGINFEKGKETLACSKK